MNLTLLNDEYSRFTSNVADLKLLSTQLNESSLDPIKASQIESNLAKLGIILLHASLEQYFKWLLARKLGFNSIQESANLLGQLTFLKPNTLPTDEKDGAFSMKGIFKLYGIESSVQEQQRNDITRYGLVFNHVNTKLPQNFKEMVEHYTTFINLRNQIAHESDLAIDINFETLEQFYISSKIMFVYYVGFLLFKCEFPEGFNSW